jgi:glyceraldehyde 3-phosphate dehydrogenase
MKIRIAINGFGRIGRNALKIAHGRNDIEVVAINDLADNETLAHLLKHDSNYPSYEWCKSVQATSNGIIVDGKGIYSFSEKDPAKLPWKQLNVDVVIESTGFFNTVEAASSHIKAGAKRVVVSALLRGEGRTIVLGVNDDQISEVEDIVSNASCTTNCAAPVVGILEQSIGVKKAMLSTVHSYTTSQKLQDAPAHDLREARNAGTNIVPTVTGAAKGVAEVVPQLKGRFGGLSVRVPTPVVSIIDLTFVAKKSTSAEEVNNIFKEASKEPFYQGIVAVSEEPLVSSDYIGNSHSATVDLSLTEVVDGDLVRVVAWYDNEWGYSNRLVELSADVGRWAQESARRQTVNSAPAEPKLNVEPTANAAPSEPKTENANQQNQASTDASPNKKKRNRNKNKNKDANASSPQTQAQQESQPQQAQAPVATRASTGGGVDTQPAPNPAPTANSSEPAPEAPAQPEVQASATQDDPNSQQLQENLAEKLIAIEGTDYIN